MLFNRFWINFRGHNDYNLHKKPILQYVSLWQPFMNEKSTTDFVVGDFGNHPVRSITPLLGFSKAIRRTSLASGKTFWWRTRSTRTDTNDTKPRTSRTPRASWAAAKPRTTKNSWQGQPADYDIKRIRKVSSPFENPTISTVPYVPKQCVVVRTYSPKLKLLFPNRY